MSENRVTFYRNGNAHESYEVRGSELHGGVTATISNDTGDLIWSHGYTSSKESKDKSAKGGSGYWTEHVNIDMCH